MEAPARNTYDEVPYEGTAFRETHPDHLAAIATLFVAVIMFPFGVALFERSRGVADTGALQADSILRHTLTNLLWAEAEATDCSMLNPHAANAATDLVPANFPL